MVRTNKLLQLFTSFENKILNYRAQHRMKTSINSISYMFNDDCSSLSWVYCIRLHIVSAIAAVTVLSNLGQPLNESHILLKGDVYQQVQLQWSAPTLAIVCPICRCTQHFGIIPPGSRHDTRLHSMTSPSISCRCSIATYRPRMPLSSRSEISSMSRRDRSTGNVTMILHSVRLE